MKGLAFKSPRPIEEAPLEVVDVPDPRPGPGQVLIRVSACGLCHTDLHIIEGELPPQGLPRIPGHQIVGVVEELGTGVSRLRGGERVGVPWLYSTCGRCAFCLRGQENLCPEARFTGYHVDGGFAQYVVASQDYVYPIPSGFPDLQAAPLLCAGVIGFRALRQAGIKGGERLGLYGFGASAHLVLQVAAHWGCRVYVFTRSPEHRALARELGAIWTGRAEEEPPEKLDGAIIFAPAGPLVSDALRALNRGGTLVLAGIYMSPIPSLEYAQLYYEKTIKSVAHMTRKDAQDFLALAGEIPIRTQVQPFPFEEANGALRLLKEGRIQGAGVLVVP